MSALLRVGANLLRVALSPIGLVVWLLSRPRSAWIALRIAPTLREVQPPERWWRRLLIRARQTHSTSLAELRELARRAAADRRVAGVLVHLPPLRSGLAAAESLRGVLRALRDAGKEVVCFLPEGGGNRELLVALAGSRVFAAPYTTFGPLGFAARPLYLHSLLARIGIEVQAQACGEYKSAAEPALRDSMSEPAREQTQALVGSLHASLRAALCERGGMTQEKAEAVLAAGLLSAARARELGVIDAVVYEDELLGTLSLPADPRHAPTPSERYLARARMRVLRPVRAAPYVAVIAVRGTIVADAPGPFRSVASLGALTAAIRQVAADRLARAAVLYVASPGGSALASELLHRELSLLARKKPLVASLGDVAASGGYYLASACSRIVAHPTTITGSIGVISVKASLARLLSSLGVHPQVVKSAERADMFSLVRPLEGGEQELMQQHASELYARFLQVVSAGRGKPEAEIEPLARGRVWSGRDAHERGLVDVLGGFERAVEEARALVPGLDDARRARLEPRLCVAEDAHVPPPPISAWGALGDLVSLCAARTERVLYYAPLPEVDCRPNMPRLS